MVNVDGAQIVCIRVPQADWRAKPIYLNGNVYKGTYRRNNEGDYHCTEAQVKAMIRDSNVDGNDSILIEYYGSHLVGDERYLYRGGNSKARNPKIQNMLRMIGFGENVGSGFPKILAAWKETNWGEPQLLNKLDVDEVELVLPVPSIMGGSDGVSNRVPNGVSDSTKVIFAHIKENPNISRNELANLTGISLKNIQKHINKPIMNLLGYQQSCPHVKRRVRILTLLITNQCSLSQMFGSLSNNS